MKADTSWLLGIVLGACALTLGLDGHLRVASVLAAAGGIVLTARMLAQARARLAPGRLAAFAPAAGLLALLAGLGFALAPDAWTWGLPPGARVALLAMAAQAVLLAAGLDGADDARLGRLLFPLVGHATALLASVLVLQGGSVGAASLLAYASGFGILALHAFWVQRAHGAPSGGWEPVLLGALVLGLAAATLVDLGQGLLPGLAPFFPALEAMLAGAAFATLAFLAGPPPAPRALRRHATGTLQVLADGGAAIGLLNVLFLAFSLVAGWSLRVVLAALLAWQAVAVGMEYRALKHAEHLRRSRPVRPSHEGPLPPITVVVAACDEADVLPASMAENLRLPRELRFLLVPAVKSGDATVQAARALAAAHPGRVRVVLGTGGSKAEDLNLAWEQVRTDLVLILDADETLDERALRRGLAAMLHGPQVGVVQGRKVSRHPDHGFLARFVSAERRYSTRMDHPMHADSFGSAHFAGSGALVRRRVAREVGGWTTATMTEDIEFTLRVHTLTPWRIAYEPRMVVRERDPQDTLALLRQRTRWARGWTECFLLYFLPVLRARRQLGRKRAAGLAWLLLTPVSALWTTLVPAMLVLRLAGLNVLPFWVAVPMALLVLPSRLLAYGYAALRDPVIPLRRTPGRVAELMLHAYGWIALGWFIQLHALYLELSAAPRTWYVTRKRAGPVAPASPAAPAPLPAEAEPKPLLAEP